MWEMTIKRVDNGYIIVTPPEDDEHIAREMVIEEDDNDELKAHEMLLYNVMEYFSFGGSKHDKERIQVTREKQS